MGVPTPTGPILGLITAGVQQLGSALFGGVRSAANAATGGVAGAVGTAFTDPLNSLLLNPAKVFEQYRISLTKASGATSDFVDKVRDEAYAVTEYGVSFKKLIDINTGIAESIGRATFASNKRRDDFNKDREQIAQLIAINEKFGVGVDATTTFVNKFGNAVFQDVDKLTRFSDSLLKFSRETGQPFNRVMSEFASYNDRFLASLDRSDRSIDKAANSFSKLELIARRSNTSVSSLVTSISKFDDIDQAFSSGGQINRILSYFGGSFDTLAAANASDDERAKMLLESISSIGDKYQQMTNPSAKRAILKELESATGFSTDTLVGLLNKKTDLDKELQSIMRTGIDIRPTKESFTVEEKKAMAMDLTTGTEAQAIATEMVTMNKFASALDKFSNTQKAVALKQAKDSLGKIDEAFSDVIIRGDLPGAINKINKAATEFFGNMTGGGITIGNIISRSLAGIRSTPGDQPQKKLEEESRNAAARDIVNARKERDRKKTEDEAVKNRKREESQTKFTHAVNKFEELTNKGHKVTIELKSDGKTVRTIIVRGAGG